MGFQSLTELELHLNFFYLGLFYLLFSLNTISYIRRIYNSKQFIFSIFLLIAFWVINKPTV